MTFTHYKPEIWAAEFITQLRKALVYGGPQIVNHNYEGQIQEAGDTVHISGMGPVTVGDYAGTVIDGRSDTPRKSVTCSGGINAGVPA